ncbi:MAG: hypothetical protein NTW78_01455 [Campylobacterales bacterium]|nr:hypothetical protein [Campylobacterales bacterium]
MNGAIKVIILYTEEDINIANTFKKDDPSLSSFKRVPVSNCIDATVAATAYYQLLGEKRGL